MQLQPACSIEISLTTPLFVGAGPFGNRIVASLEDGTVRGERLNGTMVGAGGDWMLMGADGFARIDVRCQLRTDDDALVYVSYAGLLELNEAAMAALLDTSAETDWDDQYFRVCPRFEAGDDRYAWLNQSIFVARGRVTAPGIEYEVHRVA